MNDSSGGKRKENKLELQPEQKESQEKDRFKEILAFMEKTDLEFVEITENGKKVSLQRSTQGLASKLKPAETIKVETAKEKDKFFSIRSPIVGRFYNSSGPDRPPFVLEGARVTAGQRVAIVEAMKIKKEVFSAITGKVIKISLSDGEPVEYGQELFSVELENESA